MRSLVLGCALAAIAAASPAYAGVKEGVDAWLAGDYPKAVAEWKGPDAGLEALATLKAPGWLLGYYLWDATLGELHRRRGDRARALEHTKSALAAAPTNPEKALLERRMKTIEASGRS